jgi:Fur family transcriptional regulator, ferric uptake regulator
MIPTRHSRQRQVILEELRMSRHHPTATELYEAVRERLPRVSLGTVYRNLELLVRQGHIRRLEGRGAQARYDGDLGEHLHLHCVRCGGVADIPRPRAKLPARLPRAPSGHLLLGVRIEYAGLCPHCRAELEPEHLAELRRAWK